ncbi:hypothetical protein BJ741DRAFT_126156 [Chytriomyces cf. hyalinus JEL632]|nr:hypothetical protein BJ741DRAFT_126156 [Chytriomyces cf. hyalinus JEL632]
MSESTPTNGRGLVAPMDDLIQKVAVADPDEFDDDEALMARAKKIREEMEKKSQLALPSSNLLLPRLHGDSVTEFQPQQQIPQQPAAPFSFGNNMRYEFKIGTPAGRTSWRETASDSLASSPLKSASRSPAPARFGNPFEKSFFRHQSRNAELFKTVDQDFSRLKQKLLSNANTPEGKRSLHFHMKRLESYQERDMFERAISPSLFNQPQINAQSRVILCQWMNEFCSDKRFLRCTFHRAITVLGRVLGARKKRVCGHSSKCLVRPRFFPPQNWRSPKRSPSTGS